MVYLTIKLTTKCSLQQLQSSNGISEVRNRSIDKTTTTPNHSEANYAVLQLVTKCPTDPLNPNRRCQESDTGFWNGGETNSKGTKESGKMTAFVVTPIKVSKKVKLLPAQIAEHWRNKGEPLKKNRTK
ncbi:hypothetical protein LOAG_11046 [Loa loa]|uniref:Uncharacterized protein n=1 Tax=Loa loa TaxID=7209 RepID=A0A1S0TNM0_LOALO|nr:hypothetical protein LOAG_11046 [Loa loa]EFO17450.1 hypothetical protein LOAG_11046 [Loa loa]